jgi:FxsC-like protein
MARFFFSYARGDGAGDPYLNDFYDKLSNEVAIRSGIVDRKLVGFRDTSSIPLGQDWPPALANALGTAPSMVCMYSPTYFTREDCGKEWSAFSARLEAAQQANIDPMGPPRRIPVLWHPPKKVPAVAATPEWWTAKLGSEYEKYGLRHLAKLEKFGDAYKMAIDLIADAIFAACDAPPIPSGNLQSYANLANAFAMAPPPVAAGQVPGPAGAAAGAGAGAVPATSHNGAGHIVFVIAAGRAGELDALRAATKCYGADPTDWKPFLPPADKRIGPLLQAIAGEADLTSEFCAVDDQVVDQIRAAAKRQNIVVLVIDAWTARLQHYSQRLTAFDAEVFPHCGILVPHNDQDPDWATHLGDLELAIQASLPNRVTVLDAKAFRNGISSYDNLKLQLREVIAIVQSRIVAVADLQRRAAGAKIFVRPTISARPA